MFQDTEEKRESIGGDMYVLLAKFCPGKSKEDMNKVIDGLMSTQVNNYSHWVKRPLCTQTLIDISYIQSSLTEVLGHACKSLVAYQNKLQQVLE